MGAEVWGERAPLIDPLRGSIPSPSAGGGKISAGKGGKFFGSFFQDRTCLLADLAGMARFLDCFTAFAMTAGGGAMMEGRG